MLRIGEQLLRRRLLDRLPQIHDHDLVGDMIDHRQIMRDKYICQPQLLLELSEEVEYLRLYGYVQRRYRLVAHDELGLYSQRTRYAYPLPSSAVQLVRIAVDQSLRQSYGLHELQDAPLHLLGGLVLGLHPHRLCYRLGDGLARIE